MKLISFIIPAYNAAPYLQACLDSVYCLDMGVYEREVIVINDGSTDQTGEVLRLCQSGHPDLICLNQPNQGLSAARNQGLAVATGKYICFVDADDAINTQGASQFPFDRLERESIDLIGINVQQVSDNGLKPYRRYVPPYGKKISPAREFMKDRNLMPCAWAYLYRREFLQLAGLRFHKGIFHEDEEWTPMCFLLADSFVALDVNFYYRYVRPESITTTTDKSKRELKIRNMLTVIRTLDDYQKDHEDARPYLQFKMDYLCVDLIRLLHRQHHRKDFRKEAVQILRDLGYFPLRPHPELKYKLFSLLIRCIY